MPCLSQFSLLRYREFWMWAVQDVTHTETPKSASYFLALTTSSYSLHHCISLEKLDADGVKWNGKSKISHAKWLKVLMCYSWCDQAGLLVVKSNISVCPGFRMSPTEYLHLSVTVLTQSASLYRPSESLSSIIKLTWWCSERPTVCVPFCHFSHYRTLEIHQLSNRIWTKRRLSNYSQWVI